MPNYYKTLQLDKTASEEQIWLAYNKLVFLHKKRVLNTDPQKMAEAEAAFQILLHPQARAAYDRLYEGKGRGIFRLRESYRHAFAVIFTGFVSTILVSLAFSAKHSVSSGGKVIFVALSALIISAASFAAYRPRFFDG